MNLTASRICVYIFVSVLIGLIGVAPHAIYSYEQGRPSLYKSGYDEDTYAERALVQRPRSDRVLSNGVLRLLLEGVSRNHNLAFPAADFLFPAVSMFLALVLATPWAAGTVGPIVMALAVLFGQETLSMGCQAVWPSQVAPWNWVDSELWRQLVPFSNSASFALFRTPEPQMSWILLLGFFIVWQKLLDKPVWSRRDWLSVGTISVLLGFTYVFIALPLYAISGAMTLLLVVKGRKFEAVSLAAVLLLGLILKFTYDFGAPNPHMAFMFESRVPTFTISLLLSLLALLLARRLRDKSERSFFFQVTLAIPLLLNFQQVITGRMVSVRDFEIYVAFPLLAIGIFGLWSRHFMLSSKVKSIVRIGALGVFAAVIAWGSFNTYSIWKYHNVLSSVYLDLIQKNVPESALLVVHEGQETISLIKVREGKTRRFLLDFNEAQDVLVEDMIDADTVPVGREKFSGRVYEYAARVGMDSGSLSERLKSENVGKTNYFLLPFLFSIKDTWGPLTENRSVKRGWVDHQLPMLEREFERFLGDRSERRENAFILSLSELSSETPGYRTELVETRPVIAGWIAHLYRQTAIDATH